MRVAIVIMLIGVWASCCVPPAGEELWNGPGVRGKTDTAASLLNQWVRLQPGAYDGVDLGTAELVVASVAGEELGLVWEWARQQGQAKYTFNVHVCKVREVNRNGAWVAFSCEAPASPASPSSPPPSPSPSPGTQFLGFHDCGALGSPIIWSEGHGGDPCDNEFHQLMSELGGRGWVTVVGYVGGSFLEGYQLSGQGRLNLDNIPAGTRILLRLDSAPGRAFPPIRAAADYDHYGQAVVDWLARSPGSDRVDFIQLGNEQDQYLAEYPQWESAWSQGKSDQELGLAVCDFFGPSRKVQYMTPKRYAKLFVAVGLKLRAAGKKQRLVTSPPMPMRFAQYDGNYSSPDDVCIDNSVGDYLKAIANEAAARGLQSPVGGIGLHLQGVGHDATSGNTKTWLQWSLDDAHTLTKVVPSGGAFKVVPAGQFWSFSSAPVFVSEIHPPPPFWASAPDAIESWVVETAKGVKSHNAQSGHKVLAVTFYRWKPGSDVPFGTSRAAVVAGVKQAIAALGL